MSISIKSYTFLINHGSSSIVEDNKITSLEVWKKSLNTKLDETTGV
jgi:hypothetical protein